MGGIASCRPVSQGLVKWSKMAPDPPGKFCLGNKFRGVWASGQAIRGKEFTEEHENTRAGPPLAYRLLRRSPQ